MQIRYLCYKEVCPRCSHIFLCSIVPARCRMKVSISDELFSVRCELLKSLAHEYRLEDRKTVFDGLMTLMERCLTLVSKARCKVWKMSEECEERPIDPVCNDLQGHSLHMRDRLIALTLPRYRVYIGYIIHTREGREERDLRASHISQVSHISYILTSLLYI